MVKLVNKCNKKKVESQKNKLKHFADILLLKELKRL